MGARWFGKITCWLFPARAALSRATCAQFCSPKGASRYPGPDAVVNKFLGSGSAGKIGVRFTPYSPTERTPGRTTTSPIIAASRPNA